MTYEQVAFDEMNTLADGELTEMTALAGVLFSNATMASKKSLIIPLDEQLMGHFVFFTIDCKTGVAKIFDTLNDSFSNSQCFLSIQCKRFFNFLIQSRTYNFSNMHGRIRSTRDVDYYPTKYNQLFLECGVLACFNLILYYNHSLEFLRSYTLQTPYQTTVSKIKSLIIYILLNRKLPKLAYCQE